MSATLQAAWASLEPQLLSLAAAERERFMADFGDMVASSHADRLRSLFELAARAKLSVLKAATATDALEASEIYETVLASLETLALADAISADAAFRRHLVRAFKRAHDLLPVAAGIGLRVGLSFVPVGAALGPVAGAGVEYLIREAMS